MLGWDVRISLGQLLSPLISTPIHKPGRQIDLGAVVRLELPALHRLKTVPRTDQRTRAMFALNSSLGRPLERAAPSATTTTFAPSATRQERYRTITSRHTRSAKSSSPTSYWLHHRISLQQALS